MFSITGLLIGLSMVVAGVLFVKFSFQILGFTGNQQWLERYTGSGSTNGMYKLFGVALILFGFMIAGGFGDNVMNFLLSPFKSVFHPLN